MLILLIIVLLFLPILGMFGLLVNTWRESREIDIALKENRKEIEKILYK